MRRIHLIAIYFAVNASVIFGFNLNSGAQELFLQKSRTSPRNICATPQFTVEYLQKVYENTIANDPGLFSTGLHQPIWLKAGAQSVIGDSMEFWAVNIKLSQYYKVMAELRGVGNKTLIWAEKSSIAAGHVTDDIVANLINDFEESTPPSSVDPTMGIIEIENEYFGMEPDKDGDGKTDILLLDIQDYYDGSSNLTFVSGFFSPTDQTNITQSNKRDMLYLDTYPAIGQNVILTTASHEYQHLIHYNYDSGEETFINEGASQLAQIITGQGWDYPGEFFMNTGRSLTDWANVSDPLVIADYAKVQMFFLYMYEQLGKDVIKNIVQNSGRGISSITSSFQNTGVSISIQDFMKNWFIANYINNVSFDPRYGYQLPQAAAFEATIEYSEVSYPAERTSDVLKKYAAEYIMFTSSSSLSGFLTSSLALFTAVVNIDGTPDLTDVASGVTFTDTTLGTDYSAVVFMCMNNTGNNTVYSYSFDSYIPYFVTELSYDDGNPDVITGQQSGVRWGANSPGYGWAIKFTPENDSSVLLSAKVYAAHDTIYLGRPEFDFRVLDATGPGGSPGQDIITPKTIKLQHSPYYSWYNMDLASESAQLSNHQGDFYIAFVHPEGDTNAIFIAVDNSTPTENHSWVLRSDSSATPGWSSMADQTLGDVSLAPFDLMVRVNMSYLDMDAPILTPGVLQHPVFTENFDVYVAGAKKLSAARLSGSITVNSVTEELNLFKSGSTGKVYVDNEVTITDNGIVSLQFKGTYEYGYIETDTLLQFSVQKAILGKSGKITNPDGMHSLFVPAFNVTKNTTFSAVDGFEFFESINNSPAKRAFDAVSIGKATTFGPPGFGGNEIEVNFRYSSSELENKDPQHLRICLFIDGRWTPLDSRVDVEMGVVSARISRLGTFQLKWSENFPVMRPERYSLEQNYPNPFNSTTKIVFSVMNDEPVSIKVFDVLGCEIQTVTNEFYTAGTYNVEWDGTNINGNIVSSGVYFYRIKAGSFDFFRKMVLIR